MNKKLLVMILAAVVVLGIAHLASANVTVSITIDDTQAGATAWVWQWWSGTSGGNQVPADGRNFDMWDVGVDEPGGSAAYLDIKGDDSYGGRVWVRIYNDQTVQFFTADDEVLWVGIHNDPGQDCPWGPDSEGVNANWFDYHPHGHPSHLGYDGVVLGPEYDDYEGAILYGGVAPDSDGDGVGDHADLCPDTPPATQVNADGCPDADGDGVADTDDNCSGTPPGTWVDEFGCAMPDTDEDGVYDPCDLCPGTPGGTQVNTDGCPDADGDGVPDTDDLCPGTPGGTQINADGCPDADGDGVADGDDLCPGTPQGVPVDSDGCPYETEFTAVLSTGATAWGDYNNDGFSDMFGGNTVWTNNGDGTFAYSAPFNYLQNVSLGDYNNDGYLDVVSLASASIPHLFTNDGDGTWTNDSAKFAAGSNPWNVIGTTWGDFNGDGYLDTYWTGWYLGTALDQDVIYTSNEALGFHHSWTAPHAHGKGVTPCDFDEDADIDIFVSNYWMTNSFLWRNDDFDGNTGLTEISGGVLDASGHTQGSCWADFDSDGDFDLFVANFAHPGNPECRFQENQGAPGYGFTDKGKCGIVQVEPLSCGIAGDYDNDGDVDILITMSGGYSWTTMMMYRNDGDWTFTEVTSDVGLAGQGPRDIAAWGDYNNDGYLDLLANGQLWRNPGGDNHWVKVKLLGGPHPNGLVNGAALGAQVRIDVPGLGTLARQVEGNTGQGGSQNDQVLHFGLGDYSGQTVDLDILWPNGYEETVTNVPIDQPAPIVIQLLPPPTHYDLTTAVVGSIGGTLTPASGPQLIDSTVNLLADPCEGWQVLAWGGDAVIQPGAGLNNNTVVMDAAKSVTVEFEQLVTVPPCWDYLTQCHGDTDGDGDVDTVDWPIFRDSFGYAYPSASYHPCGDMDHDGDVDTVDWPEFRDNFGYTAPSDCTPGGTWPPTP